MLLLYAFDFVGLLNHPVNRIHKWFFFSHPLGRIADVALHGNEQYVSIQIKHCGSIAGHGGNAVYLFHTKLSPS